jgi:serine/threonine protein kinase
LTRKPAQEIADDGLMRGSASGDMLAALVVGREEPGFPRGFGKYELLERVGAGGMAEVFRAVVRGAEGFEKEVCIKRILPMFTEDEDFVRMFIDEAALASKLHHANIVQTLDFDKIDGQYYIALEFVEGRDSSVLSALSNPAGPS